MTNKDTQAARRCTRERRRMLLETTGELSRYGRLRLRRHLACCEACRAACAHITEVNRWWALAPEWSAPPPGSVERILAGGAQPAATRGKQVHALSVSTPVWRLAAAAALLIAWLGWEAWRGGADHHARSPLPAFPVAAILAAEDAMEDDLEQALATWDALLALLPGDDGPNGRQAESEWQRLAHELLEWGDS